MWDKASAKLFAVPGKCTADRSRLNRAGMSAALQANECGVSACTHIESVRRPSCWLCLANAQQIGADQIGQTSEQQIKLGSNNGKCTADRSRLNWAVIKCGLCIGP